jgi:SAM-dependent methyltransferase
MKTSRDGQSDTDSVTDSGSDDATEPPVVASRPLSFCDQEYWNQRYEKDNSHFEWYVSWALLKPVIASIIEPCKIALHVGCGTSTLGVGLIASGIARVVNIDISPVVISYMAQQYADESRLQWQVVDIRQTNYRRKTFDLVIDKGTMDAFMCSDVADRIVYAMLSEISRILKPGGFVIVVSSGAEPLRKSFFEVPAFNWTVRETLTIPKQMMPGTHYYVYCAEKNPDLDPTV